MESQGRAFQAVDRQEAVVVVVRRLDVILSAVGGHWSILSQEARDLIYFLEHYPGCLVEVGGGRQERNQREEVPLLFSF